ncbi:MAG: hypothetical protein IJO99_02230 [Ruminococcus sp.]|nr:hypothetical protein [Ruminococcus sp.]MBQ9956367.1 hypothetical protein [Ruminococcus sp.]
MLKGVNKRIIEINNPQSLYFEKAIFYLRPEVRELPAEIAQREVEKYIERTGISQAERSKRKKIRGIIMAVSGIILAVALIYLTVN